MILTKTYIDLGEAAKRLGVTVATVRDWITKGVQIKGRLVRLQGQRVGRMFRTTVEYLDDFVEQCNEDVQPIGLSAAAQKRQAKKDKERLRKELAS